MVGNSSLTPRHVIFHPLHRNVTITGGSGSAYPLLDFAYMQAVVQLCTSCTLTLTALAITRARRGTGSMLDFIRGSRGSPGSVLHMHDMYRMREACMPVNETVQLLENTAPAKNYSWQPQQAWELRASWRGREYPDSLVVKTFSQDVPPSLEEGRGWVGGYTLVSRGVEVVGLKRFERGREGQRGGRAKGLCGPRLC